MSSTYPRGTRIGPYEILALLPSGKGGMGAVYLARPRANYAAGSPPLVALKMAYGSHNDFLKYEVEHMERLSHPNILRVLPLPTVGTNPGRPIYIAKAEPDNPNSPFYISVEYMRGGSVEQLLQRRGRLTPSEAVEIAKQVAVALAHIHNNQIVHLDIKDSNILLRAPLSRWSAQVPEIVVSDFGIAWSTERRQLATVYGSQLYTAPERAAGGVPNPQHDIFSLGVLLYQMLVGRHPFTSVVVPGTQIMEHSRPSRLNPAVSPELEQIILRAVATDPVQRYQTVHQLYSDLENLPGLVRPGRVRLPLIHGVREYLIATLSGVATLLLALIVALFIPPPPPPDVTSTSVTSSPTTSAVGAPNDPTSPVTTTPSTDSSRPTSTTLADSPTTSPAPTASGRPTLPVPQPTATTSGSTPANQRATSTTIPATATPSATATPRPTSTRPPAPPTEVAPTPVAPPTTEAPPPQPTEAPPEAPPPQPTQAPPPPPQPTEPPPPQPTEPPPPQPTEPPPPSP